MSAPHGSREPSPVLRDASTVQAPRLVGRVPTVTAPAQAPAAAPQRASAGQAVGASARPVDEEALRQARDQARAAGIEEGRQQALREQAHAGFEEGLRQGLVEGRAAGEVEAQRRLAGAHDQATERLHRLDQLYAAWSEQLHVAFRSRLEGAEDDMVALCHGVVCRLLGDHLVTQAGAAQCVRTAIDSWLQAIEKQSRGAGVVVHVHPADLDTMRNDELLARWLVQQGLRGMAWEASEGVRLGGCIVHSGEGDLDARLETQLENLRAQLTRSRHGATGAASMLEAAAR